MDILSTQTKELVLEKTCQYQKAQN